MARNEEKKRGETSNGSHQPRRSTAGTVSAEDIRRLVAKLKGEEFKK